MARVNIALWTCVFLFSAGCSSIGTHTITRDRFDYNAAISDSWKNQMLLNLIKIRYGDSPVFLDVASVISQYEMVGELRLMTPGLTPSGGTSGVGVVGKYMDRPTITYNLLTGKKFVRRLLSPLPPAPLMSLIQAGWPVDFMFRMCVQAINGIHNSAGAQLFARKADPEFFPLLHALKRLQESSALGIRVEEKKDKKYSMLYFRRKNIDESTAADIADVKHMLGLNPESYEFRLSYGSDSENGNEIAVLSRSMFEIMTEIASHVEVPVAHVKDKSATPTNIETSDASAEYRPLIRIQSDSEKPDRGFVAVQYEDYWFWIDKRDLPSKRTFSILLFLFRLAETGDTPAAPLLTVPIG
jgi:hypothetical protein